MYVNYISIKLFKIKLSGNSEDIISSEPHNEVIYVALSWEPFSIFRSAHGCIHEERGCHRPLGNKVLPDSVLGVLWIFFKCKHKLEIFLREYTFGTTSFSCQNNWKHFPESNEALMSESNTQALLTLLQLPLFQIASVQIDPSHLSVGKSSIEIVLLIHSHEPWLSDQISWELKLELCGKKIFIHEAVCVVTGAPYSEILKSYL